MIPANNNEQALPASQPMVEGLRVAIVVVTFNSGKYIEALVRSLSSLNHQNFKIYIVDNCSLPEEVALLEALEARPEVELLKNIENSGFAAGNNLGIRKALVWQPDYLWLLNADTLVEPSTLTSLLTSAEANPGIGCWGSLIYSGEPRANPLVWAQGGEIDQSSQEVSMKGYGQQISSETRNDLEFCDYIPGCSMFFRPALIRMAGFMPEDFFMYFEETAWCAEMRKKGLKLAVDPESVVWHLQEEGKTSTVFHTYYYNRNQLKFWFQQATVARKMAIFFKALFRTLPKAVWARLHAPDRAHKAIFNAHIMATLDFLLGRSGRRIKSSQG